MRAEDVVRACAAAGLTVATAESLTGGLVCAALTDVPGSSAVVRGAVVAYATDVKVSALGVSEDVVRRHGVVSAQTAVAMAQGVRTAMRADVAVATTGVAGPDRQENQPAGTVHVAVVAPSGVTVVSRVGSDVLTGDRTAVRHRTVELALTAVGAVIGARES